MFSSLTKKTLFTLSLLYDLCVQKYDENVLSFFNLCEATGLILFNASSWKKRRSLKALLLRGRASLRKMILSCCRLLRTYTPRSRRPWGILCPGISCSLSPPRVGRSAVASHPGKWGQRRADWSRTCWSWTRRAPSARSTAARTWIDWCTIQSFACRIWNTPQREFNLVLVWAFRLCWRDL